MAIMFASFIPMHNFYPKKKVRTIAFQWCAYIKKIQFNIRKLLLHPTVLSLKKIFLKTDMFKKIPINGFAR